jgi:hypothetical protein
LWFFTTSTACSARSLQACCIPLPTLGFAAFPGLASRRCRLDAWDHFPRRASHPSKNPPRQQQFYVSVAIASLPLSAPSVGLLFRASSESLRFAPQLGQSIAEALGCAFTVARRSPRFQVDRSAQDYAGSRLRGLAPLASP